MIDLSIKKKLLLSFSVLCLLMSLTGLYSLSKIKQLHGNIDLLSNTSIPVIIHANDINKQATDSRRYILALFAKRDSVDQLDKYAQMLSETQKEMTTLLSKYESRFKSPQEQQIITKIRALWTQYCEENEQVQRYIKSGAIDLAMQSLNTGSAIYDQLNQQTQALTNLSLNNAARAESESNTAFSAAQIGIITCLIVSAIFVFILASLLTKSITKPLFMILEQARQIADGNLARSQFCEYIESGKLSRDELGELGISIQKMKEGLHALVSDIMTSTSQVSSAVEQVNAIAQHSADGMQIQQNEITQLATAMNEMQATVQDVSMNTTHAATAANDATRQSISGNQIVHEAVQNIQEVSQQIEHASQIVQQLEQDSASISVVLDVIRNIADQTNLLALNAAIEAARAGEQGRGFAVVADEVRTLAQKTQDSTTQINQIIESLQKRATEAGQAMQSSCQQAYVCVEHATRAGESIQEINAEISKISDMSSQIATATEEQSAVANELNKNIVNINTASTEVAEGAVQTVQACVSLAQLAQQLNLMTEKFKL
ncbi:methyl-accepting chemotaxis protein [Plesiomonas shigelloides]|uniref:methyl-accepting chemotaxis protein n=1 Tax=Plesiomonas shigelloides TaxID=703 RepID=UPI0012620E62|nr:methyl-accepting chemotaxis protein [Plesiomonas shigelloides]KAB7695060.1 HAMP domain-containing protein [Plesiomonas shigelloides]